MTFMPMRKFLPIFIYIIIGLNMVSAATFWSYTGYFSAGSNLLINSNITVTIDYDVHKNTYFAIITSKTRRYIVPVPINGTGETINFNDLEITLICFNNMTVLTINSKTPLSIEINATSDIVALKSNIRELNAENSKLREKIALLMKELTKQKQNKTTTSSQDFNKLQLKILNLTKENRKLKAELNNLTGKYNALTAENEFLKSQLTTYKSVFSGLVQQVEKHSEDNYISEAKTHEKTAKRLWEAAIVSTLFVGGFGMLMYRKKRKYELE